MKNNLRYSIYNGKKKLPREETKAEPTLMQTSGLAVKHNDVFHCLYEGKFVVSLRRARVGPALLALTLA